MQNKITTIFFDLFGVLLGIDQSVVIQYLSNKTEASYLKIKEIVMGELFMRLERNDINFSTYIDKICIDLPNGEQIEKDILRDKWVNARLGEMPAVSFLNKLQPRYKVWIISNTNDSHIRKLKSHFTFLNNDKLY